jgi:hypothetical protein
MNILKKIRGTHVLMLLFFMIMFLFSKNHLMGTFKDSLRTAYLMTRSAVQIFISKDKILETESLLVTPLKNLQNEIDKKLSIDFNNGSFVRDKGTYINFNGLMARLAGQRFCNGIVKLNNGYLSVMTKKLDMSRHAQTAKKLNDYLNEVGVSFLYVQAPDKMGQFDKQLPAGATGWSNENADEFLQLLQNDKIPILDLRQSLHEDGLDHYAMFFKTDNHWKPETGVWASGKIMTHLKELRIIESFDPAWCDIDNFTVDVYRNSFLGSRGQRVGRYFAGVDDISLIYPENINLTMSIPSKDLMKSGAFFDVVFDIDKIGADFNHFSYAAYPLHPDNLIIFKNDSPRMNKKILLLSDSFGTVTAPYLALQTKALDFFYGGNFNVHEYIKERRPDLVIMLYYPLTISDYFSMWAEQFK